MTEHFGLDLARSVLDAQPFSVLLGAEVTDFGDGHAVLRLPIEEHHRQQYGLVHGGVYSYLADNALTYAGGSVLGPSVLTSGFSITYVAGAREGVLEATARAMHHDDRQAVCSVQIEVTDARGTRLCSVAHGTIMATGTSDEAPRRSQQPW